MTTEIKIPEAYWSTSILPEGIVEQWFVTEGNMVNAGHKIAEVRIEDALHEILAPAGGNLSIFVHANGVIEPGAAIGAVT